jgi:hypothetical protein
MSELGYWVYALPVLILIAFIQQHYARRFAKWREYHKVAVVYAYKKGEQAGYEAEKDDPIT